MATSVLTTLVVRTNISEGSNKDENDIMNLMEKL